MAADSNKYIEAILLNVQYLISLAETETPAEFRALQ